MVRCSWVRVRVGFLICVLCLVYLLGGGLWRRGEKRAELTPNAVRARISLRYLLRIFLLLSLKLPTPGPEVLRCRLLDERGDFNTRRGGDRMCAFALC
jgi:hypothetical protein